MTPALARIRTLGQFFVTAGCLALVPAPARAQIDRDLVGFEIGYSRADLGGAEGATFAARASTLAGAYYTARFGRSFAVQPQLLLALKGGRLPVTLDDGTVAVVDFELAYIEVPVLLRLSGPRFAGRIRPVVFGGVAPAFNVGCNLELEEPALRFECNQELTSQVVRLDLGLVGGFGVEAPWSDAALGLQFRYTLGTRRVLGVGDARNRQFAITFALSF